MSEVPLSGRFVSLLTSDPCTSMRVRWEIGSFRKIVQLCRDTASIRNSPHQTHGVFAGAAFMNFMEYQAYRGTSLIRTILTP